MRNAKQLLDYLGTQEEAVLTFNASNMVLAVHATSENQKHAVEQVDISFYQTTREYQQTTDQSSKLYTL